MLEEINLLGIRKRAILLRSKTAYGPELTIIEPLTEAQENRIDKSKDYFGAIQFESKHGTVSQRDIYVYGKLDLSSKEDLDIIKRLNLVDEDFESFKYSDFNYNKGTAIARNGVYKIAPTFNAIEWFKYNHCLIGKPERIIVYKLLKYKLND